MKILYVKNNSERAKPYQLKTIIFEKNGTKYVKKEALCKEAIPHLKKMKENYHQLSKSIITPNVKLTPIIEESENSLTFEFIEGISLEKKLYNILQNDRSLIDKFILDYLTLLKTSFSTTKVLENHTADKTIKNILHNIDFNKSDDFIYFKDTSNIDLIFSNIIYTENEIYLIDYEWVFPLSLPIDYALYRSLRAINTRDNLNIESYINKKNLAIFNTMEKNFFNNDVVTEKSFYNIKNNYNQNRINIYEHLQNFRNQVHHLQNRVSELETQLHTSQHEVVSYASSKSWKLTRPMRKIVNYFKDRK